MELLAPLVIVAIIYLASRNWRLSVYAVFLLLVGEGILRKWVLPQASDLVYFLKDLVLLGAYLNYFFFSRNEMRVLVCNFAINVFLILSTGWCLFQAFNPSLGSPIAGLFGLRGYLFYVPLMWLSTNLFQSQEALYKFIRLHLLLLIPVGLLGIVQFFSPPSSPINLLVAGEVSNAGFSGLDKIRITGTFSYIAGYTTFLGVCFALLLPTLSRNQPRIWRWAAIVEITLLIANSFMTGSRGVVLANVIFLVLYISFSLVTQASTIFSYVKRFTIPAILVFFAINQWFGSAFGAFYARSTGSDNLTDRIANSFEVTSFFAYKQLDGYGAGATHQAIGALRNVLNLPQAEAIPVGFESEMGRIALELGPIGFVVWYGLRISIIIALGFVFLKLKHPFLRELALAAFLIHLIYINGQLVVNHTFLVYYWFLASFIFLLPHLEQVENLKQQKKISEYHASTAYFSRPGNSQL